MNKFPLMRRVCFILLLLNVVGSTTLQPAIAAFFETQNAKDCLAFVAAFNVTFSVVDPYGSAPVTNKSALLSSCQGSASLFKTISLLPTRSYPVNDAAAVEWVCTSIAPGKNGGPDCQLNFTGVDVSACDSSWRLEAALSHKLHPLSGRCSAPRRAASTSPA